MSSTHSISPSPASSAPFGLVLVASGLLVAAAALWGYRSELAIKQDLAVTSRLRLEALRSLVQSQEAGCLLERGLNADTELPYSALVRTRSLLGPDPMSVEARIERAPGQEIVTIVNGPVSGSETGYAPHWLWRQAPGGGMMPYAQLHDDTVLTARRHFKLLMDNYSAVITGPSQVAGRKVDVVEVKPLVPVDGAIGPARRLFLDSDTGLALRVDSFDYQMKPVSISTLSNVEFRPAPANTFPTPAQIVGAAHGRWEVEELGSGPDALQQVAARAGFMPPQPTYLPPGFVLDGYGLHRCRQHPAAPYAAMTRYSDGLNTLTIFAMRRSAPLEKAGGGSCDFGSGTMVTRYAPPVSFVALADLPPGILRKVLDTVSYQPSPVAAANSLPGPAATPRISTKN